MGKASFASIVRLACFANFVGGEGVFDVGQNPLLSGARQFAHAFKNLARFADGPGAAFFFVAPAAQKIVGGNPQGFGELAELIGAKTGGLAFPVSDDALSDSESIGQLLLSESGFEPGRGDAFAECGAFGLGRSSHGHGWIIRPESRHTRNRLHTYTINE